jgi:arylsulfatase A-like enzyme
MPSQLRVTPSAALIPALLGAMAATTAVRADPRPNIVVILADDLGYSDPGCFGGEIPTPALDQLAGEGVRFTRVFNGGMCVVSRRSLMTGKWWPRGTKEFRHDKLLSEHLHEAGYRTALIGKWHLGGDPMDRGFDHFFGFLGGFSNHFEGGKDYRLDREAFTDFGPDFYSSDAYAERASTFIARTAAEDKPFFLYLSFQAPHNPLQAPLEDIRQHRGKYLEGWQAVREARFQKQQEAGLFPEGTQLPDYPQNLPDWDSLSPAQRDLEDLRMATYAAMVERMDRAIGHVMETLEHGGQAENTIVIFASDNGTDPFSVVDQPLLRQGKLPGDRKSNFQPGTGWAYAAVTPWRLYKISQHGGGVTTGTIMRWPKRNGPAGRIVHTAVHFADIAPTLLEIAGVSPGKTRFDGASFVPLLQGQSWRREAPMFFQFFNNRAIRTRGWTLVEVDGAGWELFNTTVDPLETRDLAATHPDVVSDLSAQWDRWWTVDAGEKPYVAPDGRDNHHYRLQGDRGSGVRYTPSAMPAALNNRIPLP